MRLWIEDGNFNTEEIERGIEKAMQIFEKAMQIFEKAGVSAEECHKAQLAEVDGQPTNEKLVELWREAERLAISEAAKSWAEEPEAAILTVA